MTSPLVPDFILTQQAAGRSAGRFECSSLFADISGFTGLTERLMAHGRGGAELLAEALRFYFDPLVDAVHEAGGWIPGFAGDAFTALFLGSGSEAAGLAAAGRMQSFFREHPTFATPYGSFDFGLKVGLSAGLVAWQIVPVSLRRSICVVHGPAIDRCARTEHHAQRGDVLYDQALASRAAPQEAEAVAPGLWRLLEAPAAPQVAPFPATADLPVAQFLPDGVAEMPAVGEFRNVASAFVAFEGVEDLAAFLRLVYTLGERFGGTFNGLDFGDKGGNFLIHFGAPVAHENDPQRALDFTLELLASVGAPIRLRAGATYDLRYAGFNGGWRRHEFACLGRGTNLAARLMMQAPWGELWCPPAHFSRALARYEAEERGEHHFKGFAEPLSVSSVAGHRPEGETTLGAERMLGRQAELELLLGLAEPLRSGRFAGIAYIDGEAGIGKSLLAEALRRQLQTRWGSGAPIWLEAVSDQTFKSAWAPLCLALARACGQKQATEPGARKANLAAFELQLAGLIESLPASEAELCRELERLGPFLAALLGLPVDGSLYERVGPQLRHENTLQAVVAWLQALSCRSPVVLHLEDGQWLDSESRAAVERLCRVSEGHPIWLLITSRYQDDGAAVRLELPSEVPVAEVPLDGVSPAVLAALCRRELGGEPAPGLLALLAQKAQGNPFYAEQILLHAHEQGLVERRPEGLAVRGSDELLPRDVNGLLIARLDRLAREVKETVQAAAVLGQDFLVQALSAMLHLAEAPTGNLEQARHRRIWDRVDELRYLFRHALLRDAAYQMQARSRLRLLHRAAAEALETLHREDRGQVLEMLAHHWERGGELAAACDCYLGAARRARDRYAHGQAEADYRAHLRLLEAVGGEGVSPRLELGRDVLTLQGRMKEAEAVLREALELARRSGSAADATAVLLALGNVLRKTGRRPEARELYRQAQAQALEAGDRRSEGVALASLGHDLRENSQGDEARLYYTQALEIHRASQHGHEESIVVGNLGLLHQEQGRLDEAEAAYRQALAIIEERGDRQRKGLVLANLAIVYKLRGQLEQAGRLYAEALAIHQEVGDRTCEGTALGNQAILHFEQGRQEECRVLLERALAVHCEVGSRRSEARTLANLANLHWEQGRPDMAVQMYHRALTIFRELDNLGGQGQVLSFLGSLHFDQGRPQESWEACEQSLAALRATGLQQQEAGVLRVMSAHCRLMRGAAEEALSLADRAVAILRERGIRRDLGEALGDRGLADLAAGRSAARDLGEVQQIAQELGQTSGDCTLGRSLMLLERAQQAFDAHQHKRLFRGQLLEHVPPAVVRYLRESGQLPSWGGPP